MSNILIVEDDKSISSLINLNLTVAGYKSEQAYTGIEAMSALISNTFDLVLLDVMLPDIDGFSLMEKIKPTGIPVIFLTARNGLEDKVKGLTTGAEDYIVKPFEAVELLARIEVVLRRFNRNEKVLVFDDLEIDLEERKVNKQGLVIEMTPKEYELLLLLLRNRNKALSREKILEMVWGYDYLGETRTVDIHIQKLRKKLALSDKLKTAALEKAYGSLSGLKEYGILDQKTGQQPLWILYWSSQDFTVSNNSFRFASASKGPVTIYSVRIDAKTGEVMSIIDKSLSPEQ